jgi:hypothetical protein
VSLTLGASAPKPARRSGSGVHQGCEYELDPAGADGYEYISIWLGPAADFGEPESRLATDRGLGQEVSAEWLDGIGDAAYAIYNASEQQTTVFVRVGSRLSLEVTAESLDHARELAKLAVAYAPDEGL